MGFEDWLRKVKEHWLAVVLIILLLFAVKNFLPETGFSRMADGIAGAPREMAYQDLYAPAYSEQMKYAPPSRGSGDFAPEEKERKIEKSASIAVELERGQFETAQEKLQKIVKTAGGFIINQNMNRYGKDEVRRGIYALKIPTNNYAEVIAQLHTLGEVESASQNAHDVTGEYLSTENKINLEKKRLERYQALYKEWGNLDDKLKLEDKVFDQERLIEELEQSIKNMGQRVDYSDVQVTLREKESEWSNIGFVAFGSLAKTFVGSLETLLYFVSAILPWAVALLIIWAVVRWIKNRFRSPKLKR